MQSADDKNTDPEHYVSEALAALKRNDFPTTRAAIIAYAQTQPLGLKHYLIKGLAETALSDWTGAERTFSEAAAQHPGEAQLWFNLGIARENLGCFKEAAENYERSFALKPNQPEACGNLSNIYRRLARFTEAEAMARRALDLGAPKAQALNSLGLALAKQNKFAEAEEIFWDALKREPNNLLVLSNLANLAVDQLDFADAWPFFTKARAASQDSPLIRRDEAMARLLSGEFEMGWKLYEARLELPHALRVKPPCPMWRSESISGKKLLLLSEQGFGDAIQFCRYGVLLKQAGAELIWVVRKPLERLFAANLAGQVITEESGLPDADFYLPILSLPLALDKLRPEDAPPAPYLRAPGEPKLPPSSKKKIGLVWTGSPTHERDHERSIPLARFAEILKLPAQFYAPFTGFGLDQITDQPVMRLDNLIKDFADAAALLKQLDCLVTVDTASAHLAGALGVKTILLLPYAPDWRWGTQGETTPWYPSLTLLRQPIPGDWAAPVARLAERLKAL